MVTRAATEASIMKTVQVDRTPGLALALLKQKSTYSEQPERIDIIETHMSWVFLTKSIVYKLKKPVHYDFLDFSTLAARKKFCAEEVRLNRRLAKTVYLGMVPLVVDANGRASIGEVDNGLGNNEETEVVDWLVKMRRLPANRMLNYMIQQHCLMLGDVKKLAQRLAEFYQGNMSIKVSADDYLEQLQQAVKVNFLELLKPKYGLPVGLIEKIQDFQFDVLENYAELFVQRVKQGRIVEGHGDLRPEHVCLEYEPVIFDCLEFSPKFRTVDCVDELSSLSMECELLGAPEVGEELFLSYESMTGDKPSELLVCFYKSYRACVRARLAILHVQELEKVVWPKWQHRAERYLLLAQRYRAMGVQRN